MGMTLVALSDEVQGAIVGGIIGIVGGFVGALVGPLFQSYLSERGRVAVTVTARQVRRKSVDGAEELCYTLTIDNQKSVGIALVNLRFEFYKDGNLLLTPMIPKDSLSGFRMDILNLPANLGVTHDVVLPIPQQSVQSVRESDQACLVGHISGERFRRAIPLPRWTEAEVPVEESANLTLGGHGHGP